jgi:mono/diheme cytochrome c family protein
MRSLGGRRTVLTGAILLVAASPLLGQELGDPEAGLALAKEACAACHAVQPGQARSPSPQAPTFERIAGVPGMSPMALTVALQTSHRTMPNLILSAKETHDVIAYITSLQRRP